MLDVGMKKTAALIAAWLPFLVLWLILGMQMGTPFRQAFPRALFAIGSAAILGLAVSKLCATMPLQLRPRFYLLHMSMAAVYAAVWAGGMWASDGRVVPRSLFFVWFLEGVWIYAIIAGASYAFQTQRRALQAEKSLAVARLDALRSRLHPHFLFNALNSVLPLVFRDREAAARTISRLEELLRRSLEADAAQLVPLSRELEFLEMYVEIQTTRFQDRLKVAFDVPPELSSARVPNLILQPLVENAIKHGVSAQPGCGRVEISARKEKGMLVLRVRDDGPGLGDAPRPGGSGLGLANTRARLEQLYGSDQRLHLENVAAGGLEVTLGLPFSTGSDGRRVETSPL